MCSQQRAWMVNSNPGFHNAPAKVLTILNSKTMTDSESSWMEMLQGQMNIISRIIDKYNYSIFNMMCTTSPHESRQCPYIKADKQLLHWIPMWDTTGSRASEMFNNLPKHVSFWSNFVITCTKTKCSKRFSVEELRIYFNGKQLHSSVIWYFFFPFLFWKHAFWIFNSAFVKASVTHIIEKMFVQWHAWEYSYLILMIKPRGQKIISRNLLLFIKKKKG